MAGRKKNDVEAGFAVLVEDLRSQFKVFGEALQGQREEFGRRFDAADARADRTDGELALVKAAVLENSREIREVRGDLHEVRGAVARIELALDKKVDRDEVEGLVARAMAR